MNIARRISAAVLGYGALSDVAEIDAPRKPPSASVAVRNTRPVRRNNRAPRHRGQAARIITGVLALGATAIIASTLAHHATAGQHGAAGHWLTDYKADGATIYQWSTKDTSCGHCCAGPKYAPHISVTVSEGVLQLHTDGTADACAMRQAARSFLYGRFAAKVYYPGDSHGAWDWPAFWLKSTRLPWPKYGEIDIAEVNGWAVSRASNGGKVCASYHYGTPNPQNPQLPVNNTVTQCDPLAPFAVGWHVYSAIWAPGIVKYYVDGQLYAVHAGATIPSWPEVPIFQVTTNAAGGHAETVRVAWFEHQHWTS